MFRLFVVVLVGSFLLASLERAVGDSYMNRLSLGHIVVDTAHIAFGAVLAVMMRRKSSPIPEAP